MLLVASLIALLFPFALEPRTTDHVVALRGSEISAQKCSSDAIGFSDGEVFEIEENSKESFRADLNFEVIPNCVRSLIRTKSFNSLVSEEPVSAFYRSMRFLSRVTRGPPLTS